MPEYRSAGVETAILPYSPLRYDSRMDWVWLLIVPLALAGWLGMAFLTRKASRNNSGWEAPVPRQPGSKRWWWPF